MTPSPKEKIERKKERKEIEKERFWTCCNILNPDKAAEAESVWSMAELDLLLLSSISDIIPLTD